MLKSQVTHNKPVHVSGLFLYPLEDIRKLEFFDIENRKNVERDQWYEMRQ